MIRPATHADLDAIRELAAELARFQVAWRVFEPQDGLVDTIVGRYRRLLVAEHARVLVAETDGVVIGMACAEILVPSRFSAEEAVELSGVVVRASSRGHGIGRALVAEAARFGRERGVDRMVLHAFSANEAGMRFWHDLGFTPRVTQFTARVQDLRGDR